MSILSKKICLIGESGVGKNNLIQRFGECHFSDEYLSTIGVNISRKTLELQGLKPQDKLYLQLLIWSVTGHSKFKAIAPSYLRGSSSALVVADVAVRRRLSSFQNIFNFFYPLTPKALSSLPWINQI